MKYINKIGISLAFCAIVFGVTSSNAQQYQFGFLSYSKVMQSMPEYASAQTTLKTLREKYEKEAQYNEESFKKMFADYLQGQKTFPEQIMLKRQKEMQMAMERGISFRQDAQKQLASAEKALISPLEQKLDSILGVIGMENGLLFIGNTDNKSFPFVHSQTGLDITSVVIARIQGTVIPINTVNGKNPDLSAPAVATENN